MGVSRSATKAQIKVAYRNLALKYHPDRHPSNPLSHLAEEKFKEIQEAYDALMTSYKEKQDSAYYSSSYSEAKNKGESQKENYSQNSNKESAYNNPKQDEQSAGVNKKKNNAVNWIFICLAIIGIRAIMASNTPSVPSSTNTSAITAAKSSFSVNSQNAKTVLPRSRDPYSEQGFTEFMQDHPEYKGQENDAAVQKHFQNEYDTYRPSKKTISSIPQPEPTYVSRGSYFTIGSTKDDVLAVQGSPTSIVGSMWFYGYDSVTFDYSTGRVTSYSNSSGNLRIRLESRSRSSSSYFTIGSTKDDVLAVQGSPTSIVGSMWFYGYDSVTFDYSTGRVTSYSNSSGSLRIRL